MGAYLLLCGQTDTRENITFPQLRLPAVITSNVEMSNEKGFTLHKIQLNPSFLRCSNLCHYQTLSLFFAQFYKYN